MRRALVARADVADQCFDPLGEGVDRMRKPALTLAASVAALARLVPHEMIEPVGNIVEPLLEAVRLRAAVMRAAGRFRAARGFADRRFQPFADRKTGTAGGL